MDLPIPFFVYWLIVKDFFDAIDFCDNSCTKQFGYCMTDLQCSEIAKGIVIGSCENKPSGPVCCHMILNHYNETYWMQPLFGEENPAEIPDKVMRLAVKAFDFVRSDYGNTTAPPNKETEVVMYDDQVHVCLSPDRIIWPITISRLRESREMKVTRRYYGTYLTLAVFDKIYIENEEKKNLRKECMSKLNISDSIATESEENALPKFYVKLNTEVSFPLQKIFSPEIQNLTSSKYVDDIEKLFEKTEPIELSESSFTYAPKQDSNCESQK